MAREIKQSHGYVEAEAPRGLKGTIVQFDRITVTGTEDVLMAAVLAQGETMIQNAAREPEVQDLAELLSKMGARIEGAGTSTIHVEGVSKLHGTEHTIIADRIEAGTFLIAGAMTRGDVVISDCVPEHLDALVAKMRQAGAEVSSPRPGALRVRSKGRLRGRRHHDRRIPGLRHRPAGPIHGHDGFGEREFLYHRDDFREPLHACAGTGAHGRQHSVGRAAGDCGRSGRTDGG